MVGVAAKPQLVASKSKTGICYQTEVLNVDLIAEAGDLMRMQKALLLARMAADVDRFFKHYFDVVTSV